MLSTLPNNAMVALRALQLNGKEAPSEFLLLVPGVWKGYRDAAGNQQTISITPSDIQAAYDFHRARKQRNPARDLVLDYEHQTLTGGEAPAAAWFDLAIRDGMLYATNVRWTDRAKKMVENGEYRYVSPVFKHNALDKETGQTVRMAVFNAALTNEPFLDELPPLVMKDCDIQLFQFTNTKESTMNPVLQFMLQFLALATGTTEDVVVAKSKEYFTRFKDFGITFKDEASMTAENFFTQVKAQFDALTKFKANYEAVAKALGETADALPEKLTALIAAKADTSNYVPKAEFLALKMKFDEREVDELIAAAMQKGKISPATKDTFRALALKDRQSFIALMDKTPEYSAVPLQKIETARSTDGGDGVTETDLIIAKHLGVDVVKLRETAKSLAN